MTEVPQGFDFSFLNEEEARKILQVLERNEELQRTEKDRISKLQKTKRDIRWLQGVTGEWFEEIQRKKFCNETDVSQMLKPPLTYRLQKEMAKNDPMELQTSRSKTVTNPKPSVSSRMSFRSSLASLFSFRRSGKEQSKVPSQRQKGYDGRGGSPVSVRGPAAGKPYSSPVRNQPAVSAFVPEPAIMREESSMPPPWDPSLLENEFFRVLDDLDSTLAQEQSASSVTTRAPFHYGSRTQFSHSYSSENRHGNIMRRHKSHCNETHNLSIYDILRPGTPREAFKTFSPRTKTIYDMYKSREPRVMKEDLLQKNTFGSTSLCFDGRQRTASPATGRFTVRSLHFPATTQNKSSFTPISRQQSPKRTPLSSIIWNRSDSFRERQEEFLGAPSPMDIDPADQYVYPQCFQERRYELYHSQNTYQGIPLNVPMDNVLSPDTLENSENMPFYHQDNPFARSFFSNTFRWNREQRLGQSSFWSQQEEHSSWSDFPQNRKPFTSDRDFEMISTEANSPASVHSHGVSSQHWGPFSPGYGTCVFRGQGDPHCWPSDFQTSPMERMDTSHVNENQSPSHFDTANVFPVTTNYHSQSTGLEYQPSSSPVEVAMDERPHPFASAQPLASSSRASFPHIPGDRGNSQSPSFQNATVTLQETFPNKPDSLPIRSCTELPEVNSNATESPSHTEIQTNIQVTEMNNEKGMSEFISEDKQLNKMDQTSKTARIPQPELQTVTSNSLPDFQIPHSQHSGQNDRFDFNAPATISSKRSPGVFSRKDTPQIYIAQRDKDNAFKKGKCFPGNGKLDSETSLPFLQERRILTSFPSPNQNCHQDSTIDNEESWSIIKNKHRCSEPTANQETQFPKREGCPSTQSPHSSRSGTRHGVSHDSLSLSADAPQDSLQSDNSFLDALVVPSSTAFSRSPSDKEPSLEEREEKDNANKNQNNEFSVNSSENHKNNDSPVLPGDKAADSAQRHPNSFRSGRGRGKVRRQVSCIEKLSKLENRSALTNDKGSSTEDQCNPRASELSTVYCTLPRKSASFLTHNRQSESSITTASIRNGPLPFQIKSKVDAPIGKCTANKPSHSSPEPAGESSQAASDLVTGMPEATKRMTGVKGIQSASVRKGPLPFLIKRAMSCPSGESCVSTERGEREESSVPDTDALAVMPRSWERIINPVKSDSSLRELPLAKRHHLKDCAQECTRKDVETIAPRICSFTLSKEDPVPSSTDMSGKETKRALHKFKTTSVFSVSGDEENVKCLEVVSIYYTLPRKPSKKFCSLLEQFTQDTDSLRKSFQGETETFPEALEGDELNCPAQEQSGIASPGDLKVQVDSALDCLSHTTDNMAVSQLPSSGAPKSTLEVPQMSVGPDISLHKDKPKTRETIRNDFAKAPLSDSHSRNMRGRKLSSPVLQTSSMLRENDAREERSKNSHQSANGANHSESNVGKCQTRRNSGARVSGAAIASTERGRRPWRDHTAVVVDDSSSESQLRGANGTMGSDCQKQAEKMLSDSESQGSALIPALPKLQLDEEARLSQADLQNLQSEPRELVQGSQKINTTDIRKVEDETQTLTWGQTLLLDRNDKNKTDLGDLEKREERNSINQRVAAMSKPSRKFPAKDLGPRRHVATIFPQSESKPGFGRLSVCRLDSNLLSPEPIPKSPGSTDDSSLINHRSVDTSENRLQVSVIPSREPSGHPCHQKSDNISQLHQNEFQTVSESLPEDVNFKDVTVAPVSETESVTPAQLTLTSPKENSFCDHPWRRSPPLPLEPTQKSTTNSLAHQQLQHRSVPSPEWEPEPHLYRSKSLKNINVHGCLPHTNHPPKVRGRHFSESTSIDNALSQLSLQDDFPDNKGYSRRFKSFSELPSSDESDSWALPSNRTRTGPKSASSISRPIDYGIFGKEQQLAFLENVKRSLTQGRLWKPSFLKNPGFLKDDVLNSSNPSRSELRNSPSSRVPEGGLFPSEPLNIYEEDSVDSDWDTDTTTDDEYYLNENDKESEL